MSWFSRHSPQIEALAAAITALAACLALVGVAVQLRAADTTARGQSARESYANFLALSVANPDFADAENVCTLLEGPKGAAYRAYVDYLLYAAEQMLAAEQGWTPTFLAAIHPHLPYLCANPELLLETGDLAVMLAQISQDQCASVMVCESEQGN
jgi:hypothetical protein